VDLSAVFGGYGVNATTVLGALLRWMNPHQRHAITDVLLVLFMLGLIACLIVTWFEHMAEVLSAQFAFGVWSMATASRAAPCAIRLSALGGADLRPPDQAVRIGKEPQA
jgi:hypothetical protein